MAGERPGPARNERVQHALLAAAADELTESGFDRFSLDRVARAAGSSKQTIYRWYASKSALIAECVLLGYLHTPEIPTTYTGDVRRDITEWVRAFAHFASNPTTAAQLRATTAASAEDSIIAARFDSHIVSVTQATLVDRLKRGIADGQLRPGSPVGAVAQTAVGALLYRTLTRQELDENFVEELVELLFEGLEAH